MYLIYCFLAYLGMSLFNASKNVAEETQDLTIAHSNWGYIIWIIVVGSILPFVTMFFFIEWYWAILINIALFLSTMIVANMFTRSSSVVPSVVVSVISIILLLILILK